MRATVYYLRDYEPKHKPYSDCSAAIIILPRNHRELARKHKGRFRVAEQREVSKEEADALLCR